MLGGKKPDGPPPLTKEDLDTFRQEIREEIAAALADATERLLTKAIESAESEPSWAFRLANKADAAMEQARHSQEDANILLGEISQLSEAHSKLAEAQARMESRLKAVFKGLTTDT